MQSDPGQEEIKILVVDDDPGILRLESRILARKGYHVGQAKNSSEARSQLDEQLFHLVLCDINMPGESGIDLSADIVSLYPDTAVIMVSGIDSPSMADKALDKGVYGYIIKPFESNELLINVANALRRRALEIAGRQYKEQLEAEVRSRTADLKLALERLEKASLDTIMRLSIAGEYKDEDTGAHILRMSRYASAVALAIGLKQETARRILYAVPMHDIGKIGVPDHILLKPGRLTPEEFEVIKSHTLIGARILAGSKNGFLRLAETIALTHHEKWDGSGYPHGLRGREIPLVGQISAIADVFDALLSERPYKPAFSLDKSYSIIKEGRDKHFRPDVVDAFFSITNELETICEKHQDEGSSDFYKQE